MTIGQQTKLKLNAPLLLAASLALVAMEWLLPDHDRVLKVLGVGVALLVSYGWRKWADRQPWKITSETVRELDRSTRLKATCFTMGFNLLLVAWIFALFPKPMSEAFGKFEFLNLLYWVAVLLFPMLGALILAVLVIERIKSQAVKDASKDVEDRLDELERLKRRDMITPEEYAAKRQEILKSL